MVDPTVVFDRLRAAWQSIGAPVADALVPGLDPDVIRQQLTENGVIPTGEVTSWWAFHNGTEPLHDATHRVTRSFWLLSLEQALEQRRIHLRVAQMGAAGLDLTPDEYYNPDWIPVLEDVSGRSVTIDCRPNLPTAVRIVDFHDRPESFHTVFFSSLTEMAAYWAFLIETGQWKWNPELNEWRTRRDFEKIPEELRWSGLV